MFKSTSYNHIFRVIGSIIVALSALILFADKVITYDIGNYFGFDNNATFIWVNAQTISLLLMAFASIFNPYKTAYLPVIYFGSIQLFWIYKPSIRFDDYLLQTYAVGSTIIFIIVSYLIYKSKFVRDQHIEETNQFIERTEETLNLIKKEIYRR